MTDPIHQIADLARLAPSVHNTQPWRFKASSGELAIMADPSRRLGPGDPTGRALWLSLGCVTETALLAAAALGYETKVSFHTETLEEPVTRILLGRLAAPRPDLVQAIRRRRTDRSVFSSQPISPQLIEDLRSCWKEPGAQVHVATDKEIIGQVADLTGRGITMALHSPAFRQELSELIVPGWSHRAEGIPTHSLELGPAGGLEPWRVRHGVGVSLQGKKERRMMLSAPAVGLVTTPGDVAADWFTAGRAYLRTAVTATELGLASSTTAAAVEAADFHLDIEAAIHTDQRLQAILRIGYSRRRPKAVRRFPLEQLLAT